MVPIVVLLVLEPFLDITTGFNDEFVLSDRQIINLSYIQDVRVSKERATTKGTVYEVEFWKNGEKNGFLLEGKMEKAVIKNNNIFDLCI